MLPGQWPGTEQQLKRHAGKRHRLRGFIDEHATGHRLELDAQPEFPISRGVLQQRNAVGVVIHRAAVLADDPRGILDVVDVSMREQQPGHSQLALAQPIRHARRRIHEQAGRRILGQRQIDHIRIRAEKTASVSLEIHRVGRNGREPAARRNANLR